MIKKFLISNKWDLAVIFLLISFSVVFWWPSQYYPLFWDSTFLVHTAQGILKSNFTSLVSQDPGYAHPTLIGLILAILWKVLGTSVTVSHVLTLPFLPILLISAYLFIKRQTNRTLGFLSAAFLAFTPVILAEYVNVYVDLPTGAFVALSLVLWQRKKYTLWAIVYACAILSKLPALAVAPYFFLQAMYEAKHKILITILVPSIVIASWLTYHYVLTGWLLVSPQSNYVPAYQRDLFALLPSLMGVLYSIFTGQGRLFLTIISIIGIGYLFSVRHFSKNNIFNVKVYADIVPIIAATIIFISAGEFGFRYTIFLYIFYITIIAKIAYSLISYNKKFETFAYGIFIIGLLIVSNLWHPKEETLQTTRFTAPDDLGIIDYIHVFRSITSYAQTHRTENLVYYGAFPENVSLSEPIFGFVKEPIPFRKCEEFKRDDTEKQVIIIHPFSPSQLSCVQIVNTEPVSIVSGSEQNGKWVDLFLVDPLGATPSAIQK
jgi:hypothetical protein